MSESVKKKKKKKRSQAPVALVYFITLLLFLGVFGAFAMVIVQKLTQTDEVTVDYSDQYVDSYNTIYARVNSKNVLGDVCLVRTCPEQDKILVVPMSPFTISATDSTSTFREVYADGGIRQLQKAVDETFGIVTDYYVTVSNTAFEESIDVIGGFTYTPSEELYQLSKNDSDDISFRANVAVTLSGRQVRLLCQSSVFSEGKQGNVEFLGDAVTSIVNNAFDQVEITTNSLDILYQKCATAGTTNLTENIYKTQKVYIKEMLNKQIQPAYSMIPEGSWTDATHFELSEDFKQKLYDEMEATKSEMYTVEAEEAQESEE